MSLIQLRPAGPNEHRCIIRQAVDFYRHLVVGGVYAVRSASPIDLEVCLVRALKLCVNTHPILSAVLLDADGEHPRFAKPLHLNLRDHICIAPYDADADWREQCKSFLVATLDTEFADFARTPAWRVFALPLAPEPGANDPDLRRYLLLLGYGHSHADGMGGLAFHRTLLRGLRQAVDGGGKGRYDAEPRHATTSAALLPTIEQIGRLPVSAAFLLSPFLSQYLPRWLAAPLGMRTTAVPEAAGSWRGNPTCFYPGREALRSGVEVLRTPDAVVRGALAACRRRGRGGDIRMTGLLHQLIVRALSEALPADGSDSDAPQSFVSQSAVDMRRALGGGLGPDDMAVCVTGYYEAFARTVPGEWDGWTEVGGGELDEEESLHPVWRRARATTAGLAAQAGTLHNQPVGLLRFLSDFRGWTLQHVGRPRDASYEMSNLTVFDPEGCQKETNEKRGEKETDDKKGEKETSDKGEGEETDGKSPASVAMESLIFAQPANVPGGCFETNVVTLRGGDMTTVFSWQRGALGVAGTGDGSDSRADAAEDAFMARVAARVGAGLRELAAAEAEQQERERSRR